jgi:hypothetical protein
MFLLYPHRPAGIFFSLVGTFCFGSGLLALLGFFLGTKYNPYGIYSPEPELFIPITPELRNFFLVLGSIFFVLLIPAVFFAPLKKWLILEEEENEEEVCVRERGG